MRVHELGIVTKLITNGLLLNHENVVRLKESGVSGIGVSVDGLEQVHDQMRGRPGLFRKVIRGIERLIKMGIPVTAITTLTSMNINQIPSIYLLLQSLGVDHWQFQPIFPLGRAAKSRNLGLSKEDYMRIGDLALQIASLGSDAHPSLVPGDSFGYYTRADNRKPGWGGCAAGLVLCGITSDGRIKGCLSMPDTFIDGDLRQRDLWDIWFDESNFSYNRQFSLRDLGPNCRSRTKANKCRGGCSSMSYACTGAMHNDPFCFLSIEQRFSEQKLAAPDRFTACGSHLDTPVRTDVYQSRKREPGCA